jgi:sugar phosphate isomerase/epimerase
MIRCFVNCNLRVADRRPGLLERHLHDRTAPELGLDPVLLEAKTPDWHQTMARRLDEAGLARGLHLPFFDLQPGSADSHIRAATCRRLREALAVAAIYAPSHLVAHGAYNRFLYARSFAEWADRAADAWAEILAAWPEHPPLHLENTHETDPETVAGLVAAVKSRLPVSQARRVGACLDIGHWYSFAGGHCRHNLGQWVDSLAPCLTHLHLHDNDGSFDQHLGPGQGHIPFDELLDLLAARQLQPTATFEPHTDDAYARCLVFVAEHGGDRLTW